jgi:outer membrane lipoprotein SlyB
MRSAHFVAFALGGVLTLPACVTTTTTSSTWTDPNAQGWVRNGRVESIREIIQRQEGDPAAGAVAGAIVGGVVGGVLGGHPGPWGYHTSAAGTLVGAVGGAMVGAAASQGSREDRIYEVWVRFEDGGTEAFAYRGYSPFAVGEPVHLTPQGLTRW